MTVWWQMVDPLPLQQTLLFYCSESVLTLLQAEDFLANIHEAHQQHPHQYQPFRNRMNCTRYFMIIKSFTFFNLKSDDMPPDLTLCHSPPPLLQTDYQVGFFKKAGQLQLEERAKENLAFRSVLTIFISLSGSVIVYSGLVLTTRVSITDPRKKLKCSNPSQYLFLLLHLGTMT